MQTRLLVDVSQILKADMHVAKLLDSATEVMFEDKLVAIPDKYEAYEIFLISFQKTLKALDMTPRQVILLKDGEFCKPTRREFLPGYCDRPKGPPEFTQVFRECQDMVEETVLSYGGMSISKPGVEADDWAWALARKIPCVLWSGDGDWLAYGDLFYNGEINPPTPLGINKKHIVVYKSLVGDQSDKIPGAKGFGAGAFRDMVIKYGDDSLDEILEMLENESLDQISDMVAEFKPFAKIMDNLETVYASYKCAKPYHPGWYGIDYRIAYPKGNGTFRDWEPTMELITADKLTSEFLRKYQQELDEAPYNSYDIEGYTTPEGKKWMEANKNKQGKMPLDVIGQVMTGFSVNTGRNCEKNYYFSMEHAETNNISRQQAEQLLNMFPENTPLIVHHSGFELPVTRIHFELKYDRGWLPQILYDTKILSGYVNEYELSGLKHQTKLRMKYDQVTYEEVTRRTRASVNKKGEPIVEEYYLDMNKLTGQEVINYGCDDSICTGSLFNLFEVITHFEDSWNCYETVDVIPPFIYSERFINGIKFDLDKLEELQAESNAKYGVAYEKIQEYLKTLYWEEVVELPKRKITVEDIRAGRKVTDAESEVIKYRWPGCEFVPATEFTSAEIKRLYETYTGKVLKTSVRLPSKLAELIPEPEFAEYVLTENLKGLNSICNEAFYPAPQIGLQSPKDMTILLYKALGLPVRVRNKVTPTMREKGIKEGNPSGGEPAIQHALVYDLQDDPERTEFLKTVLEAKSCLTEDGLYFKPYKNMPHYLDGMVHPQFAVAAQKSGRGTASGPNDGQVARDSGIRKVYVPYDSDDPNDPYVWVSQDMSSQELVHVAEHCKDPAMMDCFRGERRDIHSVTGAAIYNLTHEPPITYEEFFTGRKDNPEMKAIRKEPAKRTNFLKVYGGTEATLAIKLLISVDRAKEMLDAQDRVFPGINLWIEEMARINEERGYAVTPLGRRRHFGYVMEGNWKDKHEIRACGNHPIQGGAGEQIKLSLIRRWDERIYEKFDSFFAGTVHDEINDLVRKSQVLEFIKHTHPTMTQQYADFELQFESSIEIGPNFGTLTEIGTGFDAEAITKFLADM